MLPLQLKLVMDKILSKIFKFNFSVFSKYLKKGDQRCCADQIPRCLPSDLDPERRQHIQDLRGRQRQPGQVNDSGPGALAHPCRPEQLLRFGQAEHDRHVPVQHVASLHRAAGRDCARLHVSCVPALAAAGAARYDRRQGAVR